MKRLWMLLLASAPLFLSGCPSLSKEDKEEIGEIVKEKTKDFATQQDVKNLGLEIEEMEHEIRLEQYGWHKTVLAQVEEGVDSTELKRALNESDEALMARLDPRFDAVDSQLGVIEERLEPLVPHDGAPAPTPPDAPDEPPSSPPVLPDVPVAEDEEDEEWVVGDSDSFTEALTRISDSWDEGYASAQERYAQIAEFLAARQHLEYRDINKLITDLRSLKSRNNPSIRAIDGNDTRVLLKIKRYVSSSTSFLEAAQSYIGARADGKDQRDAEAEIDVWLLAYSGGDKSAVLPTHPQASAGARKPIPYRDSYSGSPYSRYYHRGGYGAAPR